MARIEICIDTVDKDAILPWWMAALDYEQVLADDRDLVDPTGKGPVVWFQEVPEAKTAKNRVHIDVYLTAEEALRRRDMLVRMGGRHLGSGEDFWVLADPEGHEMCLCWDDRPA
jgi:4a-hydroxytetrahydrobiopterin dehydratase